MDLMVNPTITKFAQKVDGEITELKLGAKQEDAYAQIYQKGAESGGGKVENNKTATINVSTYTDPIEITPTSGKTSMKKATITLSNIPSGSATLYCWEGDAGGSQGMVYLYSYSATVEVGDNLIVSMGETGSPAQVNTDDWTVNSVSNNGITVKNGDVVYDGNDSEPVVFARYSTGDISLT